MFAKLESTQKILQYAQDLCQEGRLNEAKNIYLDLIKTIPSNSQVLTNLGTIELHFGNYSVAEELLKKSIKINPNQPHAISNLGNRYLELSLFNDAIKLYNQAIKLNPNFIDAHFNKGKAYAELKKFENAADCFRRCIQISPLYVDGYINFGVALSELGKYEQALNHYEKAISLNPNYPEAYFNRGITLEHLNQFEDALNNYDKAISLNPNYPEAFLSIGAAQFSLKRYEEALSSYNQALRLKPDYPEVYLSKGAVYVALKCYEEALANYDHALQLKPNYPEAYLNIGVVEFVLRRYGKALANYNHAIQLRPDYAEAYSSIGVVNFALKRYEEALANYNHAIQLRPDYAEAYSNAGAVLINSKRYVEAVKRYGRAVKLKPEINYLLGNFLHAKMYICDWQNYDSHLETLLKKINDQEKVAIPFATLALISDPAIQKQVAQIYVKDNFPLRSNLPPIRKYLERKKIRIGYFSADFREHPVSYLTAELFELHNRNDFEVIAFSFGLDTQDELRKRLELAFDEFIDVSNLNEQEICSLAREMEIDIAIDLGGFTSDSRTNIFAMRAAPLQISYLGYLGTMGAEYFDYLIADPIIIPEDNKQYYTEKIIYLPSYQVNDSYQKISQKIFSREEIGLPNDAFVFCSFNNVFKLTPQTFESWMRILTEVDRSVLLLFDANETATKNIKREAEARGISSERIVFGKHLPLPEYRARYRVADLFLDSLPYNAGTTASDALRVGLPVLTQMGESFASRVAASLLNSLGLTELITRNIQEYEVLAIDLAKNPDKLEAIKIKLKNNLETSPLYNTKLFTQNIEFAYKAIFERYQCDLDAEHIYI